MALLFSKDNYLAAYKGDRLQVWCLNSGALLCNFDSDELYDNDGELAPVVRIDSDNLDATATLEDDDGKTCTFTVSIESDGKGNKLAEPIKFTVYFESINDLVDTFKDVGIHIRTIYTDVADTTFKCEVPDEIFVKSNKKGQKKKK